MGFSAWTMLQMYATYESLMCLEGKRSNLEVRLLDNSAARNGVVARQLATANWTLAVCNAARLLFVKDPDNGVE
ncbi:hypothetical protein ACET3Z_030933 [Daucus carota]